DALQRLNSELEERVAQRTAELSTALEGQKLEIAERQRAEAAARASEQFLENIVENIPDLLFVKEAATLRLVRANRALANFFGRPPEELVGKNDYDLVLKEEADFFTQKDRAVLAARQMLDIPEEPIHSSAGLRIVHTKKIPLLDARGEPQFLLGI